ncbi:hypothetical protein Emag_002066 [Eimeria magna]
MAGAALTASEVLVGYAMATASLKYCEGSSSLRDRGSFIDAVSTQAAALSILPAEGSAREPHGVPCLPHASAGRHTIERTLMDLCSFCCSDEADMGVAPFDRVAAHIGLSGRYPHERVFRLARVPLHCIIWHIYARLISRGDASILNLLLCCAPDSDDDLLDFESDGADAPTLARAVSGNKLHRGKLKGRVSSEVYRLEQNARRSREENQELQSRKGSQVSRHLEKSASRGSSSRRHNEEATSSEMTLVEKPTRRKSHGRSAESLPEMGSLSMGQKARRSSSRQMQPKTEKPSQPPRQSQGSMSVQSNLREEPKAERHEPAAFRRLSDMSPEEKALVKEFAREAVAGFDLTLLDVDQGYHDRLAR